ncbi:transcription factor HHO5-like isoform X2 [Lotus japonicus]|uniref:transcription factor HHO5-like isoform X2 n=1 Tax=Lotus japonicus TaxID=34305 RepID=UPI00258B6D63|nr:transcription factor HHO5-like isoform X2 [Lotus japonicus]
MDLCLDLSLASSPSLFLGDVSRRSRDMSEKLAMLENYVQRLEDEMNKVEAFKRELPLCMLLVKEAIARLKEEKLQCLGKQDPPAAAAAAAEESTPNCGANGKGPGITMEKDKNNWMSTVQLWCAQTKSNVEGDRSVPEKPIQLMNPNKTSVGGGFMTFIADSRVPKEVSHVPSFKITPAAQLSHSNSKSGCGGGSSSELSQPQPQPPHHLLRQNQNPRKQRRCWSPELHRRFVDALQQLGGAQEATPKQIRDLMQVEGLTNDEVKSHLQKYRLHVRRFPISSNGQANNGLWMVQDQSGDKSKGSLSQSGSPQGPLTPLLLGGSVKGLSSPGRNSADAEDEQSDCWNWKGADNQSL